MRLERAREPPVHLLDHPARIRLVRVDGRDRWVALGTDFDVASQKLRKLDCRDLPRVQMTMQQAAKKWLESYIATKRRPKDQRTAEQRVRDYLEAFMGYKQLTRITKDDLRAYRLLSTFASMTPPVFAA